ncbi:hypothetical protein FH972_015162 [Carpinus fangiana]|uniref:Uncharacterized protein n=1 Tax=Carpinus fangiana TaxID=176857 RepID=A0A5N6RDQ8_9ROSI|nr:hypothetical protein FH972_015162 [Carpinus fangiana]
MLGVEENLPTSRSLLLILTGNLTGPPPIPGGGPVCSWGPPRVGGITFHTAPLHFDIQKGKGTVVDHLSSFDEHVRRMDRGKISPPTVKDKGKKKMQEP